MRLVSYLHDGQVRAGVRVDDRVHELPRSMTMAGALAAGATGLDGWADEPAVALAEVTLLPPVPQPPKIICVGLNYADHAAETGAQIPDYPVLFPRYTTTLVADGDPLLVPSASVQLDYEGELVAVIGAGGRNIPVDQALEHVAGYSIFNDGSVRDYQRRTSQFLPGKNFDGTGGFGPEIVTADELPPGASGLRLTTTVAGEVLQDSNTKQLIFDVAHLVQAISGILTLEPGDLIVTGTPNGVGAARKPPRWLVPGETVEVAIEGIGTLRNSVAAGL
jgi:2-keto-4-pentenoate hydratase/2-oxohepta-3-ene-1,7-dioic acid hydratase in catechol pathway